MFNRIAFLSVAAAALGAAVLPHAAAAADYYDGGRGPLVFHSQDDVEIDGGRARVEHRQDLRPTGYDRRLPGPVAFDERDPDRGYGRPRYGYGGPGFGYGDPQGGYRRPVVIERPAYGNGSPDFDRGYGGSAFDHGNGGYGAPYRPASAYRSVSAPVYGESFDDRAGLPDVGCTIQEAQSTTPAGWRKTVTHRTCYRR